MAQFNDTQVRLILSAYDVVARGGLEGFSMRQVTAGAGVSSRLVYKYFETKENFLFECFKYVDCQIANAFDEILNNASFDDPASLDALHDVWVPYFKFVVSLDKQALFYYAYRDSSYISTVLKNDAESMETYFKGFSAYLESLDIPHSSLSGMNEDVLWTYVIDCTGVFAKRAIRGEIPCDDGTIEQIWSLLSRGMFQA